MSLIIVQILPQIAVSKIAKKYNPDQNVVISATVLTTIYSANAAWTSLNLDSDTFESAVLTSSLGVFPRTTTSIFNLAVQANTFSPGVVYQLQLTAAYLINGNMSLYASQALIDIKMNAPPFGGSLRYDI